MKAESPASPFRLVIGDILILLALLLTADVLIVMPKKIHAVVLKADYQEIFRYELIICAVLLLFALDVRFNLFTRSGHTGLRVAGWVLRIAVVLFTLVIAFFCGKVIRGGLINTAAGADHAIVLGLALEDGKPTDDLVSRLNTAQAYLQEYPEARLILTGGNADGSGRTEADVMHDILLERGVAEDRIEQHQRKLPEHRADDQPQRACCADQQRLSYGQSCPDSRKRRIFQCPAPACAVILPQLRRQYAV